MSDLERRGKPKSLWSLVLERFLEHRMAVIGLAVIAGFCAVALAADLIARATGLDPNTQDIMNRYAPFSARHWLGADEAGRDVFIRLVYGARVSLAVAFLAAFASMFIGLAVGMTAGYYGGFWDSALMRLTDAVLSLPLVPIMILLAALDLAKVPLVGPFLAAQHSSMVKLVLIFVLFSWMTQARLVRGVVLSLRESEFVLAARVMGEGSLGIMTRELLPNALSPVIVSVTLAVGHSILFEAALSFLGFGIQPPTPSWGNMLNNALEIIYNAPALVILPGLLIFLVVVSFNFLGDGLQDALDPKAIRR